MRSEKDRGSAQEFIENNDFQFYHAMTYPTYEYKTTVNRWEEILASEQDPRRRAEKMLEQGIIPLDNGEIAFDPILTCEALGEAERADAKDLQAEAYKRIGLFWGKMYPALTLSIWRNAERLYRELNQEQELSPLRMNLALSLFLTGDKYEMIDAQVSELYKQEARAVVQALTEPDNDASAKAAFELNKGTIWGDSSLIREARIFYEGEELWNQAISCLDEEVRILLDKGHRQDAIPLMRLIQDYAARSGMYSYAQEVEDKIVHIAELDSGPHIFLKPYDELNLLDILDYIAYCEERIVFHPVRRSAEKLGKTMDDKKFILVRDGYLMPKFREQMRLFRGESEYHKDCKPTLWRKGMDDKAIFLERLKLAELRRALSLMPENYFFNQGILVHDPDGTPYHIRLQTNALALAQHYGIKTELLDLTADKWVAAFFASTNYDPESDTYRPIVKKTTDKGVMYCYPIMPTGFDSGKLRIVGAQPFERPTEQAAFTVTLGKDDNFNELCTDMVFFCQDPMASIIVYHFANRSGRLFPKEVIQRKTRALVEDKKNNRYCPETIGWVRHNYYGGIPEKEFQKLLEAVEIGNPGEYRVTLSEEEQKVRQSHFLRFLRLQSLIEVQWFTTMTMPS